MTLLRVKREGTTVKPRSIHERPLCRPPKKCHQRAQRHALWLNARNLKCSSEMSCATETDEHLQAVCLSLRHEDRASGVLVWTTSRGAHAASTLSPATAPRLSVACLPAVHHEAGAKTKLVCWSPLFYAVSAPDVKCFFAPHRAKGGGGADRCVFNSRLAHRHMTQAVLHLRFRMAATTPSNGPAPAPTSSRGFSWCAHSPAPPH